MTEAALDRSVAPQAGRLDEALKWGMRELASSSSARLDAELLLAHVLGRNRAWVLAHGDAVLSAEQARTYSHIIARRRDGDPVAYIRGFVEWYGMTLCTGPDVLVPRPETELLAEEAERMANEVDARLVADVGTGSGALAIRLASALLNTPIVAVDISPSALAVAAHNAEVNGVARRIRWLHGNLLDPLEAAPDLIVANLPYLSRKMMRDVSREVRREPRIALEAGAEGVELYRELFRQRLRREWRCPVVFEIDPRQAGTVRRMLLHEFGETLVTVGPDYAGLERVVTVHP